MKIPRFHPPVIAGVALAAGIAGLAALPGRCCSEERSFTPRVFADYSVRYLEHPKVPAADDTVFWTIAYRIDRGTERKISYLTFGSGRGSVLLLFTSPWRLIVYADSAPDIPSPFAIIPWSPTACLARLRSIGEEAHIEFVTIDRSPSCPDTTAYAIRGLHSLSDLARLWEMERALDARLGSKYYPQALEAAQRGDFPTSVDLVRQLIQCVIPEEPRLYVLLGAAGIAQGDSVTVDAAVVALRWLDPDIGKRLAAEAQVSLHRSESERRGSAARAVRLARDVKVRIIPE